MFLPTLFISHGAPTFALEPGRLGPQLAALGRDLPRPRAVLVMSPHWMTRELAVQSGAQPRTVHDFGGFPEALYRLDYPAPGAPEVANEALALLAGQGITARADPLAGRDHGAWVPLRHLYPAAEVPVLQLSLPVGADPAQVLALGRALAPLAAQGVLMIGSGSLTHNLGDPALGRVGVPAYVGAFAEWVWQALARGDQTALLDYRARAPHAVRAHPQDDHFLPLFFALGAAGAQAGRVRRLAGGVDHGVIAMDSFVLGEPSAISAPLIPQTPRP